jgi:hypothetical protein
MSTATSRFYSSITDGTLPVAVPIQYDDGRCGLMGGGLNFAGDARAHEMVYSSDSQVRAAASIIACGQARNLSVLEPMAAQA